MSLAFLKDTSRILMEMRFSEKSVHIYRGGTRFSITVVAQATFLRNCSNMGIGRRASTFLGSQ